MDITTRRAFLLSASVYALTLCACGRNDGKTASGGGAPEKTDFTVLNRGNAGEPVSLDPHYTTAINEDAIIGDMLQGLTTNDADGKPIPGAAERWETSADGKTWTFHLRDHQWSDGMPVKAQDFVFAWRRILDPKTAAVYAQILYVFRNAAAINAGKMAPEALGARAIDDTTLELQLENPAPYLPELVMHMTTYPLPRHVIDAKGKDWTKPGNFVGNGAYTLAEWFPNDHITLTKNPKFYDAANVKIERVVYYPIQDPDAGMKRFRAGELDTQDGIPTNQIAFIKQTMSQYLHMEPFMATGYLLLNEEHKPLNDIRVRRALNLAYDRETMVKVVGIGQDPAYSMIPKGVADYPGGADLDFKSLPYPDRVKEAQDLMGQAGYGETNRLKLSMATGVGADARRIAAAVQEIWRHIFVDTDIVQTDAQVYAHNLQTGDFDIAAYGWVADYNDARNFLFLLLSDNGLNYGHYKNPKFDALIKQSDLEQDVMKRGALLAEAEKLLLDDAAIIPTRFQLTLNLVQPYVKGWHTNINDMNRTRWLSLERPVASR